MYFCFPMANSCKGFFVGIIQLMVFTAMALSVGRVVAIPAIYSFPDTVVSSNSSRHSLPVGQNNDTIPADTIRSKTDIHLPDDSQPSKTNEAIKNRNVRELLLLSPREKVVSWRFNSTYLSLEQAAVDTLLWMNHLFYPQDERNETFTFLGNIGSPVQYDHFFSREHGKPFLFSKHYLNFGTDNLSHRQFNVRRPFTVLSYSTGGKRREAEEVLRTIHTQNVNQHLNIGIEYDFFGTKGAYRHQETRDNSISLFSSYYKGNLSLQGSLTSGNFKNQENGGLTNDYFIQDTLMESQLVPVWLNSAQSVTRERGISAIAGYTFLNIRKFSLDSISESNELYIPLITSKLIINGSRFSRTYKDNNPDSAYYSSFFINPRITADSVALSLWEAVAMLEIAQFASIPGMPGIRGWIGYEAAHYYFFEPGDFIFTRDLRSYSNSHVGVAAFSHSPYLSYQGALRIYADGYRAGDKQLTGQVRISFWKDPSMPQFKGQLLIDERTPDIFYQNYFSNHYRWENDFKKEKRFALSGALSVERWSMEVEYNLMHVSDFIYFDQEANPAQADNVTITSVSAEKNFRLGGLNFFNRLVWQANTNSEVLSLPHIIVFSALFYERELVKNALTAQLGTNVFYRSHFYADSYSPALGQFYNQRSKKIGNYPTVDIFANLKWKSVLIHLKYEHANQGFPHSQYFSALHYPINPRVFKFGLSWIFYD